MDEIQTEAAAANHPFKDIPIEVTISVGHARPSVRELLDLENGSVLPLDRGVDDPVELYVGERLIALGILEEANDAAGGLAVRLTEVVHTHPDALL